MNNPFKYKAGDTVYWLSSTGFTRGRVKRVFFNQEAFTTENYKSGDMTFNTKSELKYYLIADNWNGVYMGDEVPEEKIFTSKDEMIEYYKKQAI